MRDLDADIRDLCRRILDRYDGYPLTAIPRAGDVEILTIRQGYVPLLVNYTFEDEEAKGLRSLREAERVNPRKSCFSALERLAREPLMFLHGERGSGKTVFALHVALNLAGEVIGADDFNLARLRNRVPRTGGNQVEEETWTDETIVPLYLPVFVAENLTDVIRRNWPEGPRILGGPSWDKCGKSLLLIVDGVDRLGSAGEAFLHEAVVFAQFHKNIRVLVTGETEVCDSWSLPDGFTKRQLLPLSAAQRRHAIKELLPSRGVPPGPGLREDDAGATGHPGLFYCAACLDGETVVPSHHRLADRWLESAIRSAGLGAETCGDIVEEGFRLYAEDAEVRDSAVAPVRVIDAVRLSAVFGKRFYLAYMAARHLDTKSPTEAAGLFFRDPAKWTGPMMILARRLLEREGQCDALIAALVGGDGDAGPMGALMAARILVQTEAVEKTRAWRGPIGKLLLRVVTEAALPVTRREEAGRCLSLWGDPRDLDAVVEVPGGMFTMGSAVHPNSKPPHVLQLDTFKIGKYPVTNGIYLRFVRATGRAWLSEDGCHPDRANAPAVDLTWHDARAYCDWLTGVWRREGRIEPHESVRLPTEPEWEKAARGDQPDAGDAHVYPWRRGWQAGRANSEEAGFNETCVVGLFREGRSPYGCYDMCGQVWEWTTTLWGEDMACPTFRYPYQADGREDSEAGPGIRRVLRGGCFSSAREKACCTYRGSLEPDGFWRGNGFRIVVATGGK